jgi:hypothetical protein
VALNCVMGRYGNANSTVVSDLTHWRIAAKGSQLPGLTAGKMQQRVNATLTFCSQKQALLL